MGTPGGKVDLEVSCMLWIYYLQEYGSVWVCADSDQVPEEARPVKGMVACLGTIEQEVHLDGLSTGPFLLHGASFSNAACPLAGLAIHVEAPDGFTYQKSEISGLAQRCEELGGCEL